MVRFSLFPTPLGDCGIAWRTDTVVATHLPEESSADTGRRLAARTGAAKGEPSRVIRRAIASMTALLEGGGTDLTAVVCDFEGIDPFAAQVYAATRTIPAGETSSGEAEMRGQGTAALPARPGRGRLHGQGHHPLMLADLP